MEKLRYPYEPGKAGIPFEEIFQDFEKGREDGIIIGGSGRKISFKIGATCLSVFDSEFPDRELTTIIAEDGVAVFGIRTRNSGLDQNQGFPGERHPDMFARHFIHIALQHFKNTGVEVNICRGIWDYRSDNYTAYMEELKRSGDQVKAAKSTWSGQRFSEHGFSEVSEEDVKYGTIEEDSNLIQVNFHRKPNPNT
jgi:hypothetical protein